ncbi:MAG: hypothetical protein H6741_02250 [Alphaproteobacteria bacterium]|nr:hypothetical protein [Alphaproteobacteria bacterium]MCB9791525.1 hypothetical protein [Alphaproteobacteria bacterium]
MSDTPTWTAALRAPPIDLVWVHVAGHPNAPDDPFGQEVLSLRPDGSMLLQWHQRGVKAAWSARVPPELVARVLEATAEGDFPAFPMMMLPPGAGGSRTLRVRAGGQQAEAILAEPLEKQPHFGLIARIADSLCAQVRGRKFWGEDPAKHAVTHIIPVEPG